MSFTLTKDTVSVVLRNPDSGDIHRITLNDIRRFTRSGNFKGKSDTDHWVQANYYVYKFSALTDVEHYPNDPVTDYLITQLKEFLKDTAGLEIGWTDHLSVSRTGFITSPINEIITVRENCTFNAGFEILETPL